MKNNIIFNFMYFVISLCFALYMLYINKNISEEYWMINIFIVVVLQILLTIFCFKIQKINIISLSGFFMMLCYLFYTGQIFIKILSPNYKFQFDIFKLTGFNLYKIGTTYSLNIISCVLGGILIGNSFSKRNRNSCKNLNRKINEIIKPQEISDKHMLKIGIIILLITMPFELYVMIDTLRKSLSGNYFDIFVSRKTIIIFPAMMHIIGFAILMIANHNKPNNIKVIYFTYILYSCIYMLSGSRIGKVINILILTYLLMKLLNININFAFILKFIIIGFFVTVFLNLLADIRNYDTKNIDMIMEDIVRLNETNPFLNSLEEFGSTLITPILTLKKYKLNLWEHDNGMIFLKGIAIIIPGLKIDTSNINFALNLDVGYIGGSFIAELYYSFGNYSYIIAIIYGIIIGMVSNKIDNCIENKKYFSMIYFIIPFSLIISIVRSSVAGLARDLVWSILFVFIVGLLTRRRRNYK